MIENAKLKENITTLEAKLKILLNFNQGERKFITAENFSEKFDKDMSPELLASLVKDVKASENKVKKMRKVEYHEIKAISKSPNRAGNQ